MQLNRVRCRKCGDILESKHRHDFVRCGCGAIAVDGGHEYIRRIGHAEDIELLPINEPINGHTDR